MSRTTAALGPCPRCCAKASRFITKQLAEIAASKELYADRRLQIKRKRQNEDAELVQRCNRQDGKYMAVRAARVCEDEQNEEKRVAEDQNFKKLD